MESSRKDIGSKINANECPSEPASPISPDLPILTLYPPPAACPGLSWIILHRTVPSWLTSLSPKRPLFTYYYCAIYYLNVSCPVRASGIVARPFFRLDRQPLSEILILRRFIQTQPTLGLPYYCTTPRPHQHDHHQRNTTSSDYVQEYRRSTCCRW